MPRTDAYKTIGFVDGESTQNNCISYLEKHREMFSKKTALRWTDKPTLASWTGNLSDPVPHHSINFEDFYSKVNRLAFGLKNLGIKKGNCVIIFLPMSVELYQAMFAVMQIGAISVFLDSWARRTHLGASADTVSPKAMISFEGAFQFCKEVPEIDQIPIKIVAFAEKNNFTASIAELESGERLVELTPVTGDHPALITFTTGSSGRPKGANRTHQFLSAQHHALDATIPYTDEDADLPAFPIFSLNNLAAGVTTIIPAVDIGSPTPRDPLILISQLKSCQANCCTLSPSMLVEIAKYCQSSGIKLEFLRRVVTGGAPISNDDLRLFKSIAPKTEIWVLYGSTEVEPIAHLEANEILAQGEGSGVNVGHFADGLDYKFLKINRSNIEFGSSTKWSDLEVGAGEVGEIAVSGLHVCKSYYNYPEATKQTKVIDDEGRVWHRTGDLGYLDPDSQLWLVGRIHNAIQRKGQWLFPVGAEIVLKRLGFAGRVAFLGIADPELTERTYAVVAVNDPEIFKNPNPYLHQIKEVLRIAGIPADEAILMKDIPMDSRHHSKVEYAVLREQILQAKDKGGVFIAATQ